MKTLLAALLLLAQGGQNPWDPAPRTQEYPWMSTAVWKARHEAFLMRAKAGGCELLFLGDSITEGWGDNAVWQKSYAPRKAVNFGIGGDTTQNVLWRIQNGELEGIAPKAVVLMIGTNNFGLRRDKTEDVATGIKAVLRALGKKLPKAKILLLGVFPREEKKHMDGRRWVSELNQRIRGFDDQRTVYYLDIGPKLLAPDGTLTKEVAPDFLHLSEKGYQIWADAIEPLLSGMLK